MKAKPKAQKYRNLTARGSVIYYQRLIAGRRSQFSLKTPDWNRAAARRDLYEQAKGIGRLAYEPVEMPRFGEFAARYLSEDTDHLAPTTKGERERELKPEGPVLARFGHLHLDEITEARIREWWTLEVQQTGRSTKTGRNYLNALSAVLGYARELGARHPPDREAGGDRALARSGQGRRPGCASARSLDARRRAPARGGVGHALGLDRMG